MISGGHPFSADYEQATVYTILNEDPAPLTALRTGVSRWTSSTSLDKCLKKSAEHRYQHADDLIADLKGIDLTNLSVRRSANSAVPVAPTESKSKFPVWVIGLVGVALIASFFTGQQLSPSPDSSQFQVKIDHEEWMPTRNNETFVLSDDGTLVVYKDTSGTLSMHEYATGISRVIPDTQDIYAFALSPESTDLVFVGLVDGDEWLKRVSLSPGEIPKSIHGPIRFDVGTMDWTDQDNIVWSNDYFGPLLSVAADGLQAQPDTLAHRPNGRGSASGYSSPTILPGGEILIATAWHDGYEIVAIDLTEEDVNKRIPISLQPGVYPRYAGDGIITYAQENELFAFELDLDRLTKGPATSISHDLISHSSSQTGRFDVSLTGRLIYFSSQTSQWNPSLERRTFDAETEPLFLFKGFVHSLVLSPDGKKAAASVTVNHRDADTWIIDLENKALSFRLTEDKSWEEPIGWSPDGRNVYSFRMGMTNQIQKIKAVQDAVPSNVGDPEYWWSSILADGRLSSYRTVSAEDSTVQRQYFIGTDSTNGSFEKTWSSDIELRRAQISADGEWVAYADDGYWYARPLRARSLGERFPLIPYSVTYDLRWSRISNNIYFRNRSGGIVRMSPESDPPFSEHVLVLETGPLLFWDLLPDESGIVTHEKLKPIKGMLIDGLHELVRKNLAEQTN